MGLALAAFGPSGTMPSPINNNGFCRGGVPAQCGVRLNLANRRSAPVKARQITLAVNLRPAYR
jgi:hypothetical protein